MASSFPTSLDSFLTNINGSDNMASKGHAAIHDDLADAINKIERNVPVGYRPAAVGNGVADDTAAVQAAINAASAAGGGRVVCMKNAVYGLKQAGTKTVTNPSGSTGNQGYCLSVPSNVILDLSGATLKKIDSTDSALVMNATPDTSATDHDCGVINGTLDGNNVQLTATSLVLMTGVTRPTLKSLRIINATRIGILTYNNDSGVYDELTAENCAANPYMFGQPFSGKEERGAILGNFYAKTIAADAVSPSNQPGNSFFGVLLNCTVGSLYGKACAGGTKLQGYSGFYARTGISRVINLDGSTSNSGLKFQGNAAGYHVALVVSEGGNAEGLLQDSTSLDNTVGTYWGKGNATAGANPDVSVDGTRFVVGACRSMNTGREGIAIKSTAVRASIGIAQVVNCGQVSGSASGSSAAVTGSGGSCVFEELTVIDDQGGSRTMNRGLASNSASDNIRVNNYTYSAGGGFQYVLTSTSVLLLNPQLGTNALQGEVAPTAAATTTAVSNDNVVILSSTGQPIIEIVYLNAAAQTLGMPRVTFTAGTLTFRHAAAAGTEKYGYRIVGYRLSATAAS